MLSKTITLRVPATFEGSRDAATSVREFLNQLSVRPGHAARFELVVAESVDNIAGHARSDEDGVVDISVVADPEALRIVIRDDATASDTDGLNTFMSLQETQHESWEGGRGIQLIRRIMDKVVYTRERDRNVLTMSAKLKVGAL
jgi:anti-sigma regulatory factor (Ser/Thr protein kinase)